MKAILSKNKQGVVSISDPKQIQAAKDGQLTIGDKKLLLVRGHDTGQTTATVFLEFNRQTDRTGKPFRFSRKLRFLVEEDPIWHQDVKVSPTALNDYVRSWFALGEVLQTSVGEVIILTTELPKMSVNLWMQTRYVALHAELFDWVD